MASPRWIYASSAYTTFSALDTWVELTLDCSMAQANSAFVANDIRQIGIQLDTGDPYDGGGAFITVDTVFHIDSITAQ